MQLSPTIPFPKPLKQFVQKTSFWQDNYLILREFKFFPRIAILALVFAILAAVFEGFGLGFLLAFLQNLVNPSAAALKTGIHWFDVYILGIYTSETSRLLRVSGLILVATWMRAAFNYLTQVYTEQTQLSLGDRLRKRVFEQLESLNLSYFTKKKSGELINSITGEIWRLQQAFGSVGFMVVKGLTLTVYAVLMFQISWQLSLISVFLFTLLIAGLTNLNRRVREASFEVSRANGAFSSTAIELVNSIRTMQAFATYDFERQRFHQVSNHMVEASIKSILGLALVRPLAEGLATTILIVMVIVSMTLFVAQGTLQTAALLTFLFTLFRLVPAIHELNGTRASLSSFRGSLENVKDLLRTDNKPYLKNGTIQFTNLKQGIEFIGVHFGYEANQPILQRINLTIPKGKMTALVGASGAGKSTLVDLIPRFYDPTQGRILVDGRDLRSLDINSFRRKLAVVSQDTFIFNTSIWNNIAYGCEQFNEADIQEAARLANALDFILEMPDRFDTQLGDRGMRLSGGQRQRIAIARALLRDPEILILDEATSALDSVSERLIQESLEQLAVGRTVIAIAHRLSTIVRADQVIVLEQGQIVEQGTYQELLEQRGKLWHYHQIQFELEKA